MASAERTLRPGRGVMHAIRLSTGVMIDPASIVKAEYYPEHSLDGYGCVFGGAEMRACPYLFIETLDSVERVDGPDAGTDAVALEDAGVPVKHHPLAETVRALRKTQRLHTRAARTLMPPRRTT